MVHVAGTPYAILNILDRGGGKPNIAAVNSGHLAMRYLAPVIDSFCTLGVRFFTTSRRLWQSAFDATRIYQETR